MISFTLLTTTPKALRDRLVAYGWLDAEFTPRDGLEIVEVPNPKHPYGVRGVGETPIVAPLAAAANAVRDATGIRIHDLPLSPPRVLAALDAATD